MTPINHRIDIKKLTGEWKPFQYYEKRMYELPEFRICVNIYMPIQDALLWAMLLWSGNKYNVR